MVDKISAFDSGRAQAGIQSANYKNETAKASEFQQALNAASESMDKEKIMEAAQEFESYFLQMMLKEMRNSVPKDGLIPKSNAEEIFQSMLDEEYSKSAAKGKGMGIAQMIYEQMTRKNQVPPVVATANPAASGSAANDDTGGNTVSTDNIDTKE